MNDDFFLALSKVVDDPELLGERFFDGTFVSKKGWRLLARDCHVFFVELGQRITSRILRL